jgi:hypothetical protein
MADWGAIPAASIKVAINRLGIQNIRCGSQPQKYPNPATLQFKTSH